MYSKFIKRKSANLLFSSLFHTRSYLLFKPFYSGLGSILMFHRVCPESSKPRIRGNAGLEVTPEYLEKTILFLRNNHYEIVPLGQIDKILNEGSGGKKFAVFTFDDGYIDNYLHAYPILKKHEVPFTIYVTTNLPERKAILWWYLLEDLILKENQIEFELNGRGHQFSCTSSWEKEWAFQEIHNVILNGPSNELNQRIQQILGNININLYDKTSELALTWQQIREMSQNPLAEIGAHTIHHDALNKLSEPTVQMEMEGSRDKIEAETGQKVEHFCYPFGTRNEVGEREFKIAKKCGFKTSTTTNAANIFPEHKNLLEQLPRIAVNQKRDGGNINYLNLWLNGALPCVINKFKRLV
ncbi:polysaccharide deacetylase family protein [Nitrospina gracilis]|nr:polysaccharide deacetylase family protein [Nitrospina gracilis]